MMNNQNKPGKSYKITMRRSCSHRHWKILYRLYNLKYYINIPMEQSRRSTWKFSIWSRQSSATLLGQMVKNSPALHCTALGQEDLLEKEMATQSSIPAWEMHSRPQSEDYKESVTTEQYKGHLNQWGKH